ncbi:hypothetical protein RHGRI_028265 [Rhododendron griersonianum]|uniref:Heme peroxidase n=1 Tax=Rhododendron griersonianum TaxID=479676 RepID=A0AAV6IJU1_9ERIC|nr:hypothetical protein RHGRI_028265 [Rhododendron griersonianum]
MQIVHSIDKLGIWHRLPVFLGLIYLAIRRHLHEEYNLLNVGRTPVGVRFNPVDVPFRTANGEFNDPFNEVAGSEGTFFGRNIHPVNQQHKLLKPDPMVVATKLLARRKFVDTGKQFNMIAASWIQDGSAVYGSNAEKLKQVRTFKDGKLKISGDGLLLHDQDGIPVSGDVRNGWAGISTLQALFVLEHNAICDMLKKEYRGLEDEELYRHARLVTSAVIAKDTFGHVGVAALGGLVGMKKPNNHGVPYSLTEEFVSVYRMHSLLPDQLLLRDVDAAPGPNKSPPLIEKVPLSNLIGRKGEKALGGIGFTRQMVSMGHQACGALELWNYPVWLRNVIPQDVHGMDRPDPVDLPALEVYRDRERKVARYNEFRRSLLLIPISKWEDLTDDNEAIETLKDVYGDDVEELDLLVGLMAEKKITGFAISDTAFVIFLLMASRRLEADRFFTTNFNEETYTEKGLEWVNTTESLKDVIDRHNPAMTRFQLSMAMTQGYAIELYFDPALENQVLKAWNVLARRQISTHLIEIESRPHITLFSTPYIDPSKLENVVKFFASKQESLPLSFSSIGTLPNDNNVLFLAPTPSLSLLQFHSQLCDAMKREGIEIREEYRPDSWVPYCPVAEEVPKNRMVDAFTVLRDLKLPVTGYAMDIGVVEYSPVRELFSFMLGNTFEA